MSLQDLKRRADGSYVATVDDAPYHIIPGDTLYDAAVAQGANAPMDDGVVEAPAPEPTIENVRREANRRIVAIVPEWRQRNLLAQATLLAEKGRNNWTAQELADWQAGEAVWFSVAAIRAASNVIEAMDPIPADFADDSRWP